MNQTKGNNNNFSCVSVGCDVKNCVFHSKGDICTAEKIMVENENANRKAETFCATFTPKSS
ncbi:MAG: DUF1540 domain-containing protein [Oscillospiraceae bacterium]|jgi:hypothetical protein